MKPRKPLKRTKGLQPGPPPKRKKGLEKGQQRSWNSTLRTKSDKQKKLEKRTDAMRHAPMELGVQCDNCENLCEHPHEIVAGHGYRDKSMQDPRLLMFVCPDCHKLIQGMPYAKQIAIVAKAMVRSVNRVRGSKVVSMAKVRLYIKQMEQPE